MFVVDSVSAKGLITYLFEIFHHSFILDEDVWYDTEENLPDERYVAWVAIADKRNEF